MAVSSPDLKAFLLATPFFGGLSDASLDLLIAMLVERRFEAGDCILTEYSYKYSGDAFAALLEVAGFGPDRRWHSEDRGYHVFLAGARKLS